MSIANNHICHSLKVTVFQVWYHHKTLIKASALVIYLPVRNYAEISE